MQQISVATVIAAISISATDAFVANPNTGRTHLPTTCATNFVTTGSHTSHRSIRIPSATQLYNTEDDDAQDNEIERLQKMAAKLRAEAASLEADKANQRAEAAEKAFRKFDINSDGEVSLTELKMGLEKVLKTEISDKRVKELMEVFDKSGDGSLQLDDFVTVERFRNQLEALAREEKRRAVEAGQESKRQEQEALLAEAKLEFLNDKEPTTKDKIISVLPYLFPLMDGVQYGRFLLGSDDASANPFVAILALLYTLYRSIPFSGFAAFFALNTFSGNPSINRLVRFNMQQAIYLDIALIVPSLLIGLGGLIVGAAGGTPLSNQAGEIFSDVMFGTLLLTLLYCAGSSLLGKEPDSIPLISQKVKDRMPTIDMFDNDGKFVPTESRGENDDDKSDKDKDK
mmetsp:Transcript_35402/g.62141  ORF Transcript_35402/g.62141 Transcript_35402/m.62141 type:complete len:400 (+) Transcript_35402:431-1630(+)